MSIIGWMIGLVAACTAVFIVAKRISIQRAHREMRKEYGKDWQ